jgi:acyl dehydratase
MSFLAQKRFETIDQELFAEASGDWNPMHMDPLAARRTQMGAPVVHGMHTALLCLDVFAQSTNDPPVLSAITASFLKPVYVGDSVTFLIARQSPLRLAAEVDGVKVMTIDLTLDSQKESRPAKNSLTDSMSMNRTPQDRSFTDIEKASGITERIAISNASERLFPNAARWMGQPGSADWRLCRRWWVWNAPAFIPSLSDLRSVWLRTARLTPSNFPCFRPMIVFGGSS